MDKLGYHSFSSEEKHRYSFMKTKKNKKEKKKCRKKRKNEKTSQKDKATKKMKNKRIDSSDSDRKLDTDLDNSSKSEESSDEWVEKKLEITENENKASSTTKHNTWMSESFLLPTYSKSIPEFEPKRVIHTYEPTKNSRELNSNWKSGSTRLPKFLKPNENQFNSGTNFRYKDKPTAHWKKNTSDAIQEYDLEPKLKEDSEKLKILTDQEMNELGAKIIKAEIAGDNKLARQLKKELDKARTDKNKIKDVESKEIYRFAKEEAGSVLLSTTVNKWISKPSSSCDPYSGRARKRKNVDTSQHHKRVNIILEDRYDIKQMFEREKCIIASELDERTSKDHVEDYEIFSKTSGNCDKCVDSPKMEKKSLISMGSLVYLSVPWHEALQPGHCLIIPIQHISCSIELDENAWREIIDIRKALTCMYASQNMDVIFFEMFRYVKKRIHMTIHCIPSTKFKMAPFYFKKAIQESEQWWSINQQLISLKGKDIRKVIPRGLPYFWVSFGMDDGFAHIIEDPERFPHYFAQEIIGGMLELDPRRWRRPRKEQDLVEVVRKFTDNWKDFDCTTNNK